MTEVNQPGDNEEGEFAQEKMCSTTLEIQLKWCF